MENDDESFEIENSEVWDEGEVRPAVKSPRAVVPVSFSLEEFRRIAELANRHGLTTSEFIRQAAITKAVPS